MRALVASVAALLTSTAILVTGGGLLGTLLSVRMTLEAFGTSTTGMVMSTYFAGMLLGAAGAALVIRRAGHIRSFGIFAAFATASALLHGLYVNAPMWALLRGIAGFCFAGLYMTIESWLNERGSTGSRGRLFSLYQMITYLGMGIGQFLLALRSPKGPELFMIDAVILALCLVPVTLTRAIHPTPPERHRMALRAVAKASPLGVLICAGSGIVNGAGFALAPAFVVAQAGVDRVSTFMGAMILGGAMLQYPIGYLSDRYDRRYIMVAVNAALLVVSLLVLWAANQYFLLLAAVAALYGGLTFTLYPLAVAHINDRYPGQNFVGISAAVLFIWGLGAVAGPIVIGRLMGATTPAALFLAVAAVTLLQGIAALAARWESVPSADQTPFVAMAKTTPTITEMDPRTEEADPQVDWIEMLAREMERQEPPAEAESGAAPDAHAS